MIDVGLNDRMYNNLSTQSRMQAFAQFARVTASWSIHISILLNRSLDLRRRPILGLKYFKCLIIVLSGRQDGLQYILKRANQIDARLGGLYFTVDL